MILLVIIVVPPICYYNALFGDYDPQVHLSLADVSVDSHSSPSQIRLRIKQSKTDPFRIGVDVFLGSTGQSICPVLAMLSYLSVRPATPSPLFITHTGSPLTRPLLIQHLHSALTDSGFDHSLYNGHSFQIGAATTAAQRGLEDSLIQMLGCWKSAAYKSYPSGSAGGSVLLLDFPPPPPPKNHPAHIKEAGLQNRTIVYPSFLTPISMYQYTSHSSFMFSSFILNQFSHK